ncbi:uncharacterized protein LOC126750136 [Anthonomus grandis grandis]|uniref:uncharacterized protein LOC126750136 n=1 Tax=Anthonomus grandis grandis TaxID=2921223 RepID=UPI0021657663|nr:uncharacterized protein LOC126750136 [Anthonomus grandis grandis]
MSGRKLRMLALVRNNQQSEIPEVDRVLPPEHSMPESNLQTGQIPKASEPISQIESEEITSPLLVLTECTPNTLLDITDSQISATKTNIIIECPEDIAYELGITVDDGEPKSNQAEPSTSTEKNTQHFDNILKDSDSFCVQNQHANNNSDNENSLHSNESYKSDMPYEPSSDKNGSSTDDEVFINDENRQEAANLAILKKKQKRKRSLKGQSDCSLWQKNC